MTRFRFVSFLAVKRFIPFGQFGFPFSVTHPVEGFDSPLFFGPNLFRFGLHPYLIKIKHTAKLPLKQTRSTTVLLV